MARRQATAVGAPVSWRRRRRGRQRRRATQAREPWTAATTWTGAMSHVYPRHRLPPPTALCPSSAARCRNHRPTAAPHRSLAHWGIPRRRRRWGPLKAPPRRTRCRRLSWVGLCWPLRRTPTEWGWACRCRRCWTPAPRRRSAWRALTAPSASRCAAAPPAARGRPFAPRWSSWSSSRPTESPETASRLSRCCSSTPTCASAWPAATSSPTQPPRRCWWLTWHTALLSSATTCRTRRRC
mmetsp:Transcript_3253/g.10975  ORF Transcript_3253/g.10975 Transcript_3253/m.10975 type:complete len:239 (+) Transcript_3253:545-1261(+)